MRIGIHAHLLFSGESYRNTGISQYIRLLLTAMQDCNGDAELTTFVNRSFSEADSFPQMRIVRASTPGESPIRRILFEQIVLPVLCRRQRIDLLHGTAFALPLRMTCRGVVTVHDASFLRFNDTHLSANRRYLTAISRASVKKARRVIAVSRATADDCVSLLGADPAAVRVVYNGVQPYYKPVPLEQREAFRKEKGLDKPFVLFVGTLEPRKNLWALLQAYSQARKRGLGYDLVIVGGAGWMYQEMLRRVALEGLDEGVRLVGYANANEMPLWYGAADLFVYPSLLEGFGLPVAEAMACGTPVITSNVSSMPEVGGDAAAYVSPTQVDDIANRLLEVAGDEARRAAMSSAGIVQAARFRWDKAAQDTMAVYREALAA